ncbi:MAG: ABC transporter ATP-binding protein/permease [Firmicutes bacterium]|nr:ABC transporter ATP-binding protein [Alicyclobacillaceae bacterium]MCL6497335.1 ABC transporter ATP-binding protein/permease [Bacillota bacterium]
MGVPGDWHSIWQQQRNLRRLREVGPFDARKTAARVWVQVLRPYWRALLAGTLLVAVGVIIGLIPPLLLRRLINHAIPTRNLHEVLGLSLGMFLVPVAGALIGVGQNYLNARVAQAVIFDLRNQLYAHGQALGIDFFTRTRGGEIQSRLVNDAGSLQNVLSQSLIGSLSNLFTVAFTLAAMLVLNWRLALVSAVALPSFALPVLYFGRQRYAAVERTQEALSRLMVVLEETLTLSGVVVVKAFGTQVRERHRFEGVNAEVRAAQVAQALIGQWMLFAVRALSSLGPALLYAVGGWLVIRHRLSLGTVVAFAAYLAQLYAPASNLAGIQTTVLGSLALFDRIFAFLDIPPHPPVVTAGRPLGRIEAGRPAIAFRRVTFSYQPGHPVLRGVDFEVPAGALVALVGPSGAGKSTVLHLMARFYDPDEGAVLINGVDLKEADDQSLRRTAGLVTQDVFLFHATLRENIVYGNPDADRAAVERAVTAASLDEVVARLPQGLDTLVGERGYRLSGGEKQRVAIARAILADPQILLLDEATSSLDSRAERAIQEALERLFRQRTVVAIAHRLSTILAADQILVLDRGRIVERGTHAELLARGGLYRALYQEQFLRRGRKPETVGLGTEGGP